MPASGQEFMCGPLSVEYMTMVLSAMPRSSRASSSRADDLVVVNHRVVVFVDCQRPDCPTLSRFDVRAEVHVGEVEPDEERLVGLVLSPR